MGKIVVSYGWTKINPLIYKGVLVRETGLEDRPFLKCNEAMYNQVKLSNHKGQNYAISFNQIKCSFSLVRVQKRKKHNPQIHDQ